MKLIIAVDGPAASGKGTLARRLAAALGLPHLDTGLLYRAVGRQVLNGGGDPSDPETATAVARTLGLADLQRADLRGPEADEASSKVAAIPAVRAALIDFQRNFASERGAVLDGRDIGTVIFPDAPVKLFVTASLEARAKRRWLELQSRDTPMHLDQVRQEMQARDAQDAGRLAAPLRPAPDAVLLDTSDNSPQQAFDRAMKIVNMRRSGGL